MLRWQPPCWEACSAWLLARCSQCVTIVRCGAVQGKYGKGKRQLDCAGVVTTTLAIVQRLAAHQEHSDLQQCRLQLSFCLVQCCISGMDVLRRNRIVQCHYPCMLAVSSCIMDRLCLYTQPTGRHQSKNSMVPAWRSGGTDFGIALCVVSEGGAEGVWLRLMQLSTRRCLRITAG